jgi:hypothetical protein
MRVVFGQMVDDAGNARMHIGAAEVFRGHHFAGRRLDQRRAAEKDRALILDDDRLVAHRRHVGATGGARAEHGGDLRNALGREIGLIEEDAAEVLLVRKNFVLHGQEGAAGIDQIDAGQPVFHGDFLRPQMLFHGQRVIGAALHRRIVGDDHAFDAFDAADAGDHRGRRDIAAIHAIGGELADFQKGRAGVEQAIDPLARQQLAACQMLLARRFRAAEGDLVDFFMEVADDRFHGRHVGLKVGRTRVELGFQYGHVSSLVFR